jgi:hypothetical protein
MTIADRMDVVADGLEDIGQVDWAATLRGLAAEVRELTKAGTLTIRDAAKLGFVIPPPLPPTYPNETLAESLDLASMIRERDAIARALNLPDWGTNNH